MTYTDIVNRVKAIMEEITPFDDGFAVLTSNTDVKPIVSYIESCLQSSADELLMICPIHLTSETTITAGLGGSPKLDNGKYIGTIALDSDYIRLNTFKMEGWEKEVHRPISVENPLYIQQKNPFTRGGNAKPVVVKKTGYLEIYTYDAGDTIETKTYVAQIALPTTGTIVINPKLIEPLCYLTAANVFSILGSETTKLMQQQVETLLKAEIL